MSAIGQDGKPLSRAVVDAMTCTCRDAAGDGMTITTGCEEHDPWIRTQRGEKVEFAGLMPFLDDLRTFTREDFEVLVDKLRCPGCGEVHDWSYGEPINGIPVVLCSNVPVDKLYMIDERSMIHDES